MKVALLKARFGGCGGLEKYTNRIAAAFVKKGANVSILTTQIPDQRQPGVLYQPFSICRWPGFLRLEQFDQCVNHWLKKNHFDLIFGMDRNRMQTHLRAGNGIHAAYRKSRIAQEGRLKYWIYHLNPLHRKILELEKTALSYPGLKKIFVNSRMVQSELQEHYPIDSGKVEVMHNGVEWEEKEADFLRWEEKQKETFIQLNLDPNRFHLLFIGHGYRRKGLDVLLHALSIWKFREFHLSVIGKDKKLALYRSHCEKIGLKKHVHFYGAREDVTPFYQMADALVIPSFYDPFANVTIEALAMGLFVISSQKNGGHEILTNQNGVLIEDLLDPTAILTALNRALHFQKTRNSANEIRRSVACLDFTHQLSKLINICV